VENVEDLHNFTQFKLLTTEGIKKCQNINNEEKNGQTIILDKYNSRWVIIIKCIKCRYCNYLLKIINIPIYLFLKSLKEVLKRKCKFVCFKFL